MSIKKNHSHGSAPRAYTENVSGTQFTERTDFKINLKQLDAHEEVEEEISSSSFSHSLDFNSVSDDKSDFGSLIKP